MKFRIKHSDQVVGFFIIFSLVMLVAIVILLGVNQRWFAVNYHYKTEFQSAGGISPGMAITMKGFTVGQIEKTSLNDRNTVDVEFAIYDTYRDKVRENSLLEFATSPIGLAPSLLFHSGKGTALMEEGSFIPLADTEEGQAIIEKELVDIPPKDDTITRLLSSVNPLLENVNKTVVSLNRTLQEVNRALAGQSTGPVGSMILDAAATMANVNKLVATVQSDANGLLAQVDGIMANLKSMTDAFADPTGIIPKLLDPKGSIATILNDGNALYDKIDSMLTEIDKTMKNVQAISSALAVEMPKISSILNDAKVALVQAQDVLEGLKNNPLLKGGIPERVEQQSIFQSMRTGGF